MKKNSYETFKKDILTNGLIIEQQVKNCEDKIWDDFWKNVCYEIDPEIIKEIQ